jgi:hypothetical protein
MVSYILDDASGESSGYSYLNLDTDIKPYLERETGQTLKNRDVTVEYDYHEKYFSLPLRPFTTITSVTSTDTSETSGALVEASGDFNVYGLTGRTGEYVLKFPKAYNKLKIVYNSNGSSVPAEFKMATLAHLKVVYNDNRDFTGELSKIKYPNETIYLINSYKRVVI